MLKVWGRRTSSNVQAVMWCIAELGLEYERTDVGHRFGGTDTDEFFDLNPNRTVPVLRDGDDPAIWESGAILRYLCNRYGADPFWPTDLVERTQVDKWAEWAKLNIAVGFTVPIFWRVVRTAAAERDPAAVRAAVSALETRLAIAEQRLSENDFLAGPHLTLADVQFGHLLFRFFDIDIERPALPAIEAYYQRLTQRASYAEHVMVSYEDLRVE